MPTDAEDSECGAGQGDNINHITHTQNRREGESWIAAFVN